MNERRRIMSAEDVADAVTLRVTTTDGSTNVGISMIVTNGNNVYPVTTDSQGKAVITGLSGGCTIDCTTHVLDVTQFTATGTMTVDINAYVETFPVGEVRSYGYTGSYSSVEMTPGKYKVQVWGAQGGSNAAYSSYGITAKAGGKGGYSEGVITLSTKTTVRVYVGGQGSSSAGGFNGGGSTTGSASYNAGNEQGVSRMGGGGGATDIRLSDGALLSRMIVAGGGSGGAMCYKAVTTTSDVDVLAKSGTCVYTLQFSSGSNAFCFNGDYLADIGLTFGKRYKISTTLSSGDKLTLIQRTSSNGWVGEDYPSNNTTFTLTKKSSNVTKLNFAIDSSNGQSKTYTVKIYEVQSQTSTSTSKTSQVGGVGGGTQGGGYSSTYAGKQNAAGSGGAFGTGADQTNTSYRYCSGAGGGGWYGGGGGQKSDSSVTYCKYSGGGSGFVNTAASASNRPSGYTGLELDSGTTYAGDTSFPNTAGTGNETGHRGNGYVKITKI